MEETNGWGTHGPRGAAHEELRDLVRRLDEALAEEEEIVLRKSGQVRALRARMLDRHPDGYRYRFRFGTPWKHLRPGAVTRMSRGTEERLATVLAVSGPVVVVQVERELDGPPVEWRFRRDTHVLVQMVRTRLSELWPVRSPATRFPDHDLVRALLRGEDLPRAAPILNPDATGLNQAQATALRSAAARIVTYVWGPPGTGKTETLATMVRELVRAGQTVLVVAHSNRAVDVAASRIASRLQGDPRFDRGLVQRIGRDVSDELRSEWGDRIIPDEIRDRMAAERQTAIAKATFLRELAARLGPLRGKLGSIADERLMASLDFIARRAKQAEADLREIQWPGVQRARVVVTTLHQLVVNPDVAIKYDTVILDEVSQAPLPLCLIAAASASKAIIVAGDPRQLGAVTECSTPAARHLLGTDLFRYSGVMRSGSPVLTQLNYQHRMDPDICRLVAEYAYAGKLLCAPSVFTRLPSPVRQAIGGLTWIDTHGGVARANGSRINLTHAEIIERVLLDLRSRGLLPDPQSVAVLSPYRPQACELSERLAGAGYGVGTTHAWMGREARVVIMDITDTRGLPPGRFTSAASLRDDGARALTVGASRAQDALVLIADLEFLRREGGPAIRHFVDVLTRYGRPYPFERQAVA